MRYEDPIGIDKATWVRILTDRDTTTEDDLNILGFMYESKNHEARASKIAAWLNLPHHGPVNLKIAGFGKRVIKKTGIIPPVRKDGKPRWWHIPFLGYKEGSTFPWIMRPELVAAFESLFGQAVANPEEIHIEDTASLPEGAVKQVLVNRYERNAKARALCIAHYGAQCVICGFDFEKTYGPVGRNIIHVHHLKPLSEVQAGYEVDPVRDLRPVCPNCHLIIHSRKEPLTINQVKEMIASPHK